MGLGLSIIRCFFSPKATGRLPYTLAPSTIFSIQNLHTQKQWFYVEHFAQTCDPVYISVIQHYKKSPKRYARSMIQKFLRGLGTKTLSFIHVQLFVSIVSLPILVAWGLPISTMAPLGNLFFGPFLTLFLGLSCIIFFSELCSIPNGIWIWCLEQLTALWQYLLQFGGKTWLLSFSNPSPWFFILLLGATIGVVYHKRLQSKLASSIAFAVLLGISYAYLIFLNTPSYAIAQMPCNSGNITVIKTPKTCTIIDPGILGKRISAPSWVEYTLLPKVRSDYGVNGIEAVVALAPGIVTFDALTELIRIMPVKHLYIATWQGQNPPGLVRAYQALKDMAKKQNVQMHRIGKKVISVDLDKHSTLEIKPLEDLCAYRTVKYAAIEVTGRLPDDMITLYSSKYQLKKGYSYDRTIIGQKDYIGNSK